MDAVTFDIVTGDVADSFDWKDFAVDFHFIAFHGFLNSSAYLTHACIDTGFLDGLSVTRIGMEIALP